MINVLKKVFGTKQDRDLKQLKPMVSEINSYADQMKKPFLSSCFSSAQMKCNR